MTEQVTPAAGAWSRLLHAHALITRELNAELRSAHGLTISEFEVLLLLARAPEQSLRRIDLANQVMLSPSGITRMLNRLGTEGLVENAKCDVDARVTYAVLTAAGAERVRAAFSVQLAAVERLFGDELSVEEVETLAGLLGRLPGAEESCDPDAGE